MFFEIEHLTRYHYSVPVRLGEHLMRFHPQVTQTQRPLACELSINPVPSYRETVVDAWGNSAERVYFQGETSQLEIHARLRVETMQVNVALPSGLPLPPDYGMHLESMAPYLQLMEEPAKLQSFLVPLLAKGTLSDFLWTLTEAVHGFYQQGIRVDGPPRSPAETLALGEGVCRDLSVLFMAACRQVGIATRFVSGYQQGSGTREQRYLHAWPEVFLPELGWFGFDPTHNARVGAEHVLVAAAPDAALVTPVEGGYSFNGPQLDSTLQTEIFISTR